MLFEKILFFIISGIFLISVVMLLYIKHQLDKEYLEFQEKLFNIIEQLEEEE